MKILASAFISLIIGLTAGFAFGVERAPKPAAPSVVLAVPGTDTADMYSMPVPERLEGHQTTLLSIAYQTAKDDGLKQPQLLQAILLQESAAGELRSYKVAGQEFGLTTNHRYYGVAQIKLDAAHEVLKHYPELWEQFKFHTHTDEEVIAKLIENDTFNIAVASKYLVLLNKMGYKSPRAMAAAYNMGPGGAQGVDVSKNAYATGVAHHMTQMGGVYHVQPGDWLSKIATATGASMDSIFAANPSAFMHGDPNLILANADIVIPR
jgi:LysM domain